MMCDRACIDGSRPENRSIGTQAPGLAALQGTVAEFMLSEGGTHPSVSHDFTSAAKAAAGLFATVHAPQGGCSH
jgi:hypothetical protein